MANNIYIWSTDDKANAKINKASTAFGDMFGNVTDLNQA